MSLYKYLNMGPHISNLSNSIYVTVASASLHLKHLNLQPRILLLKYHWLVSKSKITQDEVKAQASY